MLLKAVIVDDEPKARTVLKSYLDEYCPQVKVMGLAEGVKSGVSMVRSLQPDLVFIDVEMGDGTGFELLKQLSPVSFQAIFITAHNHFATQAIKFSTLDYLLKPLDYEDLQMAVKKAIEHRSSEKTVLQLAALLGNLQDKSQEIKKIVLRDSESIHIVAIDDILRLEADKNYTTFFLADKSKILISKTLKDYEQLLEHKGFFRSHQSHLINLAYLQRIDKRDGGSLLMRDQSVVPLASRRKEDLLKILDSL